MEEITINIDKIKINDDWKEFLRDEFQKKYFLEIKKQYLNAINQNIIIYPP
ncbi:uracil-DNA glycosylase, partial [Campylobacter jejuni]|nr:uracil-DNA glycosylase [Campylobacter jejuni]EEU7116747.1 uracil-DNA glycosylase [Campylobacter jejuni]ELB3123043.1 uracil-DNA glycosylase [Campylobacter jejuni]